MKSVVIVLGNENELDESLTETARLRASRAIELLKEIPNTDFLCTGSYGADFNLSLTPHGDLLAKVIISAGISTERYVGVTNSCNTIEDAVACVRFASAYDEFLIVTSQFHMYRVKYLFNRVLIGKRLRFVEAPNPTDNAVLDAARKREKKRLNALARDVRFERIDFGKCSQEILRGLTDELRHYDKVSYYPLLGAVAAISIFYGSHKDIFDIELLKGLVVMLLVGALLFVYIRFAATAAQFRRMHELVAFFLKLPSITTSSVQNISPLLFQCTRVIVVVPVTFVLLTLVIWAYRMDVFGRLPQ